MPRKHHKPEEIVAKLRQVDVLVSQGQNIAEAIRQIGVSEVNYYRWRQEVSGTKLAQQRLTGHRSGSGSALSVCGAGSRRRQQTPLGPSARHSQF